MATRKRGVVGIESAIVLIAFVIVAAALAFVVLNMGFFTTQRSKQVISSGLGEAASALEIDGSVVAYVDTNNQRVKYVVVPMKLASGQHEVDLTPGKTTIGYWSPDTGVSYTNIYNATLSEGEYPSPATVAEQIDFQNETETKGRAVLANIAWVTNANNDDVLDAGEKVFMVVKFNESVMPQSYHKIKIEVRPPIGAPLTIERSIPASLNNAVVDLD